MLHLASTASEESAGWRVKTASQCCETQRDRWCKIGCPHWALAAIANMLSESQNDAGSLK
ncbi:MAG: hypothetical protein CBB71_17960 [Rhodopirellula sp. TMED11]|nr:MAG: hypothetical protein CBB71_17960 [Rhodopirellula sp. TMED11]